MEPSVTAERGYQIFKESAQPGMLVLPTCSPQAFMASSTFSGTFQASCMALRCRPPRLLEPWQVRCLHTATMSARRISEGDAGLCFCQSKQDVHHHTTLARVSCQANNTSALRVPGLLTNAAANGQDTILLTKGTILCSLSQKKS